MDTMITALMGCYREKCRIRAMLLKGVYSWAMNYNNQMELTDYYHKHVGTAY